jgi:hypothetical protein
MLYLTNHEIERDKEQSLKKQIVRLVHTSQDRGRAVIQQPLALEDDECDAFLKSHPMLNISVIYPFRKFHSDTINVPPAKKSYIKTIVASEIRKSFPGLIHFSFFHSILSDKSAEERVQIPAGAVCNSANAFTITLFKKKTSYL